jgi:hypothetical protein
VSDAMKNGNHRSDFQEESRRDTPHFRLGNCSQAMNSHSVGSLCPLRSGSEIIAIGLLMARCYRRGVWHTRPTRRSNRLVDRPGCVADRQFRRGVRSSDARVQLGSILHFRE